MTRLRVAIFFSLFLVPALGTSLAQATTYTAYVTGEAGAADVIFRADFDPAVSGSGSVSVAHTEVRSDYRLDGIDFVAGNTNEVVVGTQRPTTTNGAITHYDVVLGATKTDFVSSTNGAAGSPPTSGVSQPSSTLTTPSHYYYTENQFGFAGGGLHRIVRTGVSGPADTIDEVFDGADAASFGPISSALANLEGLAIVPGVDLDVNGPGPATTRLYFFAADHEAAGLRALYSIALDGSGVYDSGHPDAVLKHLGGLAGPTDGADELDLDPGSGMLYGSNIVNGEVIEWDPLANSGGTLISAGDISSAPGGTPLKRMETARIDGIRANGDGFLVLVGQGTGTDAAIFSIDIAAGPAGVRILYDELVSANGFRFDDLSPAIILSVVPEPASGLLTLGLLVLGFTGHRRRRA